MTGSDEAFFVQVWLICVVLYFVAVNETGLTGAVHPEKQMDISFVVVFSVMFVSGSAVLAPAHECELGVVASVNDVLLLVPGKGQPEPFMVP